MYLHLGWKWGRQLTLSHRRPRQREKQRSAWLRTGELGLLLQYQRTEKPFIVIRVCFYPVRNRRHYAPYDHHQIRPRPDYTNTGSLTVFLFLKLWILTPSVCENLGYVHSRRAGDAAHAQASIHLTTCSKERQYHTNIFSTRDLPNDGELSSHRCPIEDWILTVMLVCLKSLPGATR